MPNYILISNLGNTNFPQIEFHITALSYLYESRQFFSVSLIFTFWRICARDEVLSSDFVNNTVFLLNELQRFYHYNQTSPYKMREQWSQNNSEGMNRAFFYYKYVIEVLLSHFDVNSLSILLKLFTSSEKKVLLTVKLLPNLCDILK